MFMFIQKTCILKLQIANWQAQVHLSFIRLSEFTFSKVEWPVFRLPAERNGLPSPLSVGINFWYRGRWPVGLQGPMLEIY